MISHFSFLISHLFYYLCTRKSQGEVLEWLKRHAWKACNRQNRFAGSNPVLSAFFKTNDMKRLIALIAIIGLTTFVQTVQAQVTPREDSIETVVAADSTTTLAVDTLPADNSTVAMDDIGLSEDLDADAGGVHHQLKKMFIDGTPLFMSLVALALVLGLAFCIERITYLTLSEINAKKLMRDIDAKVADGDVEGAKQLCRDTRGPVASICYQGLMHINEKMDDIERSIYSYGSVQTAKLEKGTSWIKLFIAMAPSLGFLGTVIGMVMAFEQIQLAGDIGATIVASGMKVALITTIFGIVVALILQLFYSYITSKIEHLTSQMEESVVTLLDTIMKYKHEHHG